MDAIKAIFSCFPLHRKKVFFFVMFLVVIILIVQIQRQKTMVNVSIAAMIMNIGKNTYDTLSDSEIRFDRRVNGKWFNLSNSKFRLYVYSALYDDRPSLLSLPVIRLTAVSDPYAEFSKRNVTRLYCVLRKDTEVKVVKMKEEPKPIGFGWPLNKTNAREYIYTCPTLKGMIPKSVSIARSKTKYSATEIPVIFPKKPATKRDFCVCVQAAYGTLDPYRIIEWMELQKILGVSLVGVYILSASDIVLKVFKHYSDEKFVDLRKIDYMYTNETNVKEFWLHLTPAINDCIYRHMYEFKRIAVLDFDEFIMPRKHQNLLELVSYLNEAYISKESPYVNFAFRNNYFFLDLATTRNTSEYVTFLKFRKKVAVSPEGYSVKSIINPQACTHMHNHYCWGVTKNYTSHGGTKSVDPEIALNQHYKKCHFSQKECKRQMKNATQDDIMLRFEDRLKRNVKEKVKQIMGQDI